MDLTPQQQFEDKNYQFRNQLEELQDAQRDNANDRRYLETLQEQFYKVQQQEQRMYQESLNEADPEERPFFEDLQAEGMHLSRRALQELEEEQEFLEQDHKGLLEKEDSVRSAHRNFLKSEGKEN